MNDIVGYKAMKKYEGRYYTDGVGEGEKIYWKVGDRRRIKEKPVLRSTGYHYFLHLCFALDFFHKNNIIFEVKAHGEIVKDTYKCATNDIEIIRIISEEEINTLVAGHKNTGNWNAGSGNTGNWNTGSGNTGNCNAGSGNTGDCNAGDCNVGSGNTGNWNAGNCNAGNWNAGERNAGDCNLCNGYNNYFCTKTRYFLFDIEINNIPDKLKYIDMYWFKLRGASHEEYKNAWKKCPEEILDEFRDIPEFQKKENKKKFEQITGIKL